MFGIGFFELLVIAVVALVFVGPKRLPEVMKQAGRFFVQMRRTANDVKSTFDGVIRQAEDEIRREEAEALRALMAKTATPTTALALEPTADAATSHPDHHGHGHGHDGRPDHGHNADGTLKTEADAANVPAGVQAYDPHQKPAAGTSHDRDPWDTSHATGSGTASTNPPASKDVKDNN